MSNEKLKPCKFCGSEPVMNRDWSSESDHDFYDIGCDNRRCLGIIEGKSAWDTWVNETGWCDSKEEAIAVWNVMN
jgi:hypothetical protein